VQSWLRGAPLLGFKPWLPVHTAYELHVSHWTGPLPALTVGVHWTYGHSAIGVFGQFLYQDKPVFGFKSTPGGNPLDTYGRNVYLDTFNSVYGPGWKRENSFLTHKNTGVFCYGFFSHGPHPSGKGERYRATIIGPDSESRAFTGYFDSIARISFIGRLRSTLTTAPPNFS